MKLTTYAECECFKRNIENYWAEQGYDVTLRIVREVYKEMAVYTLASDMVNGMPRKRLKLDS